jgi:hypothetical protein
MKAEFAVLGRTWWTALLIVVISAAMVYFGQIEGSEWLELIKWVFTVAGGTSAAGKLNGIFKGGTK